MNRTFRPGVRVKGTLSGELGTVVRVVPNLDNGQPEGPRTGLVIDLDNGGQTRTPYPENWELI